VAERVERFDADEVRRYARQIVLAEVGGRGQERLRAARARATDELEALYLAAAGVGTIEVHSAAIADAARAVNPRVTVVVVESAKAPQPSSEAGCLPAQEAASRALATLLALMKS
jgi:molybdopterin/thiamine biosynthesis adenylyltransferase